MNRTIDANIGGMHFPLEEAAYARLSEYFDAVRRRLSGLSYAEEVLADLELRAAEQFQKKGAERVITLEDVEGLIAELGTADDLAGPDAGPSAEKDPKKERDERKHARRLYRNPDDMMIAGVASGLAAYFGIDPTWVRIGFVVATLLGASGVFIYLLLWLIVPLAETPAEKLEMRGDPVTLEKMEQLVKERVSEAKADEAIRRTGAAARDAAQAASGFAKNVVSRTSAPISRLFSAVVTIACVLAAVVAAMIVAALTVGASFVAFGSGEAIDFPLRTALDPLSFSLLAGAAYAAAVIPLVAIAAVAGAAARRNARHLGASLIVLGIVWALALAAGAAIVSRNLPAIHQAYAATRQQSSRTLEVASTFTAIEAGNDIAVVVRRGSEPSVTATGTARGLDRLTAIVRPDGTLVLSRSEDAFPFCLGCSFPRTEVVVVVPELTAATSAEASRITIEDLADDASIILTAANAGRIAFTGAAKEIRATAENAGRIALSGSADSLIADAKDAGRIDAGTLAATAVKATAQNAGRIELGASERLDATARNAGRIRYAGNPIVTESASSGASIRPLEIAE